MVTMNKITTYREGIKFLYELQKYGIKFGLSKTSNLMKKFGNPHKGRKYIHIAGTNGKGSVAAFAAHILKEAGFKVGFYSSPHLVRFTERFRINGREISRNTATALIKELRDAFAADEPPTFFEATTAMALVYFARRDTDIDIMEVGMGGRLDATNIITPMVSVITNISREHEIFLGSKLLDIAGEKAGIIKKGVDVATGVKQPSVIGLLKSLCDKKKAPLWRIGKDIRYRTKRSEFNYYGVKRCLNGLEIGLKGGYQVRNAALAVCVIELLEKMGLKISSDHIRKGLKNSTWPGRMHIVAQRPTILLDGAHNPTAIRALADSIRSGLEYSRMILVMGVMADKKIGQMLRGIVPMCDYAIFTRPVYPRAASPEILMAEALPLGKPAETVPFLTEALDRAENMAHTDDLIVVCGSLFTVGEALTYFDPKTYAPDEIE